MEREEDKDLDQDGIPNETDICPEVARGDKPDPDRQGCPTADIDGDGVTDAKDVCPELAQGANPDAEKPGCPDGDDDKDGVLNSQDKCRDQAAGLLPDPTMPGCPMADRDGDQVPDLYDTCPDEPGAPDTNAKKSGCPGLVQIDQGMIKMLRSVYFATNKDVILSRSFPVLKAVAMAMKLTPTIKKVSVEGHTDSMKTPEGNLDLSKRRAESVVRWLTTTGGVEPERLQAVGHGDTRPVAPNDTAKGRAANRRVEFVIVDPEQTK
jgi:OmpA-OmpF porin, OOP family